MSGGDPEDVEFVDLDEADAPGDEWEAIDVSDTDADRVARERDREFAEFRKRIKNTEQFKVEASVFDDATYGALYKLVQDGAIAAFGGPISTGKEANVYTAMGGELARETLAAGGPTGENAGAGGGEATQNGDSAAGSGDSTAESSDSTADARAESDATPADDEPPEVAVKVYRVNASDFRDMRGYLEGDPRFEGIASDKKAVVTAWVRKEYANLLRAATAGVRVPTPVAVERNVLVMEYIDVEGGRAKRLSEVDVENPETAYEVVREYMRRLYDAGLVHGDLSEYNVVFQDGDLVVIDLGQAVTVHHGNHDEFLRRDCENVASFFAGQGMATDADALYDFVTRADED